MVTRLPGWPERLAPHIESNAKRSFEWGVFDCALFTADAIKAITGADPAAELRGRYATEQEAKDLMRSVCGGGVEQMAEHVAKQNGFVEEPVSLAQRGDMVVIGTEEKSTFGVIGCDARFAVFADVNGLTHVPRSLCRRAWRVG